MIYTEKALAKMPHSPEARRFAPQVRAVFHFRLCLWVLSSYSKFISKAFFLYCSSLQDLCTKHKKERRHDDAFSCLN